MSTDTPPAGWYPDERGVQRYWDGTRWIDQSPPAVAGPYCTNCAQPVGAIDPMCATCGHPVAVSTNFCRTCGRPTSPGTYACTSCGAPLAAMMASSGKQRITAGVLGILLGGIGVHKFYLGYTTAGIIQIVATVFTCGLASVIGLIEGILYLTKTDAEFQATYVWNKKEWF